MSIRLFYCVLDMQNLLLFQNGKV